jgi:hypothetical protein
MVVKAGTILASPNQLPKDFTPPKISISYFSTIRCDYYSCFSFHVFSFKFFLFRAPCRVIPYMRLTVGRNFTG